MQKNHDSQKSKTKSKSLKFNDNEILLFGILLVLLGLLVIVGLYVNRYLKNTDPKVSTIHSTAGDVSPPFVLHSQQLAKTDAYDVSISNVSENDKKDRAFPISDNETMLILDFSITNKTRSEQDFYPMTDLYVRNKDGDYSALHASSLVTNPLIPGKLKPGETLSGQVSFSVLKRDARPLLYVDTGWNDQVPVVFDVLH